MAATTDSILVDQPTEIGGRQTVTVAATYGSPLGEAQLNPRKAVILLERRRYE